MDLDAVTTPPRWRLDVGDVFVNFGAAAHLLHHGRRPLRPTPLDCLIDRHSRSARPMIAPGQLETEMLCGAFVLERAVATSLVRWLPAVVHAPARTSAVSNITRQLRIECATPTAGTRFAVGRLLKLLLGIAFRAHNDASTDDLWLERTHDPIVSAAAQALGDDPDARGPSTISQRPVRSRHHG